MGISAGCSCGCSSGSGCASAVSAGGTHADRAGNVLCALVRWGAGAGTGEGRMTGEGEAQRGTGTECVGRAACASSACQKRRALFIRLSAASRCWVPAVTGVLVRGGDRRARAAEAGAAGGGTQERAADAGSAITVVARDMAGALVAPDAGLATGGDGCDEVAVHGFQLTAVLTAPKRL